MRKLVLFIALATASLVSAQTEKGNYMVETAVLSNNLAPNTGIGYTSVEDGGSTFNVGLNGGYFIEKNLAVKAGLGYGVNRFEGQTTSEMWSYRGGLEYSFLGKFPVEVAYTGASVPNTVTRSYVSTQLGYNWFATKNVGIKFLTRYDFSTKNEYKDIVSVGVGLGYYF